MPKSFPVFISSRIQLRNGGSFSSLIAGIATGSVAVGVAVFLVSMLIFNGFKTVIQNKIFSNAAHIQVIKYDLNNSYEETPISLNSNFYQKATSLPNISQIRPYAHKSALMKAEDEVMGVVLKGVNQAFDTLKFSEYLSEGRFIQFSDSTHSSQIIVSKLAAKKLKLQIGQDIILYFIQNPPRARKLTIVGIYETELEEFDNLIVIGDLKLVQRLNDWDDDQVGGYELIVNNLEKLEETANMLEEELDFDLTYRLITEKYAQYFEWFMMLNKNMIIFLTIILFVALFNVMSVMLILIMERTSMIGTLKALGASNEQIQQLFILMGFKITLKGLIIGNLLGLGFGVLQDRFKLIPLDPATYYMRTVPILFNLTEIILINLLILALVSIILTIPTLIISNIQPIKAIKFQ
ncbi:MAG: ABC transporter permease [Flammeovirgaceae bacterium]